MEAKGGKSSFAIIRARWMPMQCQEVGPPSEAEVLASVPCAACALTARVLR